MTPITVRSGTSRAKSTVAAVWRASWRRDSREAGPLQQRHRIEQVGDLNGQRISDPNRFSLDVGRAPNIARLDRSGRLEARVVGWAMPVFTQDRDKPADMRVAPITASALPLLDDQLDG